MTDTPTIADTARQVDELAGAYGSTLTGYTGWLTRQGLFAGTSNAVKPGDDTRSVFDLVTQFLFTVHGMDWVGHYRGAAGDILTEFTAWIDREGLLVGDGNPASAPASPLGTADQLVHDFLTVHVEQRAR